MRERERVLVANVPVRECCHFHECICAEAQEWSTGYVYILETHGTKTTMVALLVPRASARKGCSYLRMFQQVLEPVDLM